MDGILMHDTLLVIEKGADNVHRLMKIISKNNPKVPSAQLLHVSGLRDDRVSMAHVWSEVHDRKSQHMSHHGPEPPFVPFVRS
jgi:hypothetical protein